MAKAPIKNKKSAKVAKKSQGNAMKGKAKAC